MDDHQETLRAKARAAIRAGKLPGRRPERTWGGPGGGKVCSVCDERVGSDESEFEVEFADDGTQQTRNHLHVRCLAAWEHELAALECAAAVRVAGNAAGSPRCLPDAPNDGTMAGYEATAGRGQT
jgi:hypothetical protein